MSSSHRKENEVRLAALVLVVVKNFMIASMTPTHTVPLFSPLKQTSVSWLTDIPVCVLVQRTTYHIVFALR